MSLLLDTHVLLWLASDDPRLGSATRAAVARADVLVSAISLWEIAIKQAAGRLTAPPAAALLADAMVTVLALNGEHAIAAGALPGHHRDPFDRALVAQAQLEGLVLVTADHQLQQYDVALLDASR